MRNIVLIFGIIMLLGSCQSKQKTLFKSIDSTTSNLHFSNQLIENDSLNILDNEFFYNGAGVAMADVNNDGLKDLFFSGNQVDNVLYLNKGNLVFQDISQEANIAKKDPLIWSSGVNIIDINNDGLLDIYVCNTLRTDTALRENLLYINQGNTDENIPVFKEQAKKYGLNDPTYSSHAQFFDYDNDGDQDVFIGVNQIKDIDPNVFQNTHDNSKIISVDRLYENIGSDSLGHPYFVNISKQANIKYHGYSHSTLVHDFNEDGWMDLYVANDYLSNDLVYINNKDKTFSENAAAMFKHFSLSSMGSDISDIDNDGKMDLFITEMQPFYNKRKKLFQKGTSYTKEILTRKYNYNYQYPRNVLQLNRGVNPKTKLPAYSEVGMFANVQETDWSWASLFADFDNDGYKDLLIANGFPKDVTDKDFGDFRSASSRLVSKDKLLAAIPEIKISNFVFKNTGNLQFEDKSKAWGLDFITYTNGAAYGDLDNDGDLDLVFNNIDDEVTLLENNAAEFYPENNFIRLDLTRQDNKTIFGSVATIYYNGTQQMHSVISGRGYLSKTENTLHFGLGAATHVDSIDVKWANGKKQRFYDFPINKTHRLQNDNKLAVLEETISQKVPALFSDFSAATGILHKDEDIDFIDFNFQITLPHKFSQYGPALAVADLNGDQREDLIIGGSRKGSETIFFQQENGQFIKEQINLKQSPKAFEEDAGIALFDADNDGDNDVYIVHGSGQYPVGDSLYNDVLWLNDGNGKFTIAENALPIQGINGSCVKYTDFDQDGDLDLFVGSRVKPSQFPLAEASFLLENQTENGTVKFVNASEKLNLPKDAVMGMVSDAIWTDFNNDQWTDLIVVGEWMNIRFFENKEGYFNEIKTSGIEQYVGWWNSISSADLDNDGDMDYIAGNFGENCFMKASQKEPITIIAKDFDKNGSIDPFLSYYLRDSLGTRKDHIYHPWEDVVKQYRGLRKNFNSYGTFGEATIDDIFAFEDLSDVYTEETNWMKSSWIENLGNNRFALHALPKEVQWAPLFGIVPMDIDEDEFKDLILVGNDFGVEVHQGRSDALNGVVLKNQAGSGFQVMDLETTEFFVGKDAKSLVKLHTADNLPMLIASQNNDSLEVYRLNDKQLNTSISWNDQEVICKLYFDETTYRLYERTSNTGFQSQSSLRIPTHKKAIRYDFFDQNEQLIRSVESLK